MEAIRCRREKTDSVTNRKWRRTAIDKTLQRAIHDIGYFSRRIAILLLLTASASQISMIILAYINNTDYNVDIKGITVNKISPIIRHNINAKVEILFDCTNSNIDNKYDEYDLFSMVRIRFASLQYILLNKHKIKSISFDRCNQFLQDITTYIDSISQDVSNALMQSQYSLNYISDPIQIIPIIYLLLSMLPILLIRYMTKIRERIRQSKGKAPIKRKIFLSNTKFVILSSVILLATVIIIDATFIKNAPFVEALSVNKFVLYFCCAVIIMEIAGRLIMNLNFPTNDLLEAVDEVAARLGNVIVCPRCGAEVLRRCGNCKREYPPQDDRCSKCRNMAEEFRCSCGTDLRALLPITPR